PDPASNDRRPRFTIDRARTPGTVDHNIRGLLRHDRLLGLFHRRNNRSHTLADDPVRDVLTADGVVHLTGCGTLEDVVHRTGLENESLPVTVTPDELVECDRASRAYAVDTITLVLVAGGL